MTQLGEVPPADNLDRLLRASARGDTSAFRSLYEITSARLYSVALRIVRRPDVAEEVIQDAYVTIWSKAMTQSRGSASVFGWMATIVRHRAIDILRASREEPRDRMDEYLADMGARNDGFDRAMSSAIKRCLDALDELPRRAIVLAYYQGCTHQELSQLLSTPLGTIKSQIRRGLLRLRQCLDS